MFYYIFLAGSQGQHRHRGETATQQKIENAIRNLHQELITSPIEHSITQVDRTQVPLCRDLSELQLPLSFSFASDFASVFAELSSEGVGVKLIAACLFAVLASVVNPSEWPVIRLPLRHSSLVYKRRAQGLWPFN